MSIFKCKMCGGDLEIAEGVTIAECEYCGTKQTVPKAIDENMQNLFNRANTLRIKSEFDKAEKLYEKIIQADTTQSEAYWGLILCKYGIEYVDDPQTYKKIPTCHRTSYDSIIADDDYKSAIENADMSQRIIYEEQAKEIDRIQKDILALAQKEEHYDVFICYKETDANGQRTQDSVIANDIYYQLTGEGFKVFYAAITLEGKLGSAYEPIIFAALNSAKVMLSIGTKPEYFNAVWVKNEWSRFLKIIQKDRSKLLIPCYRDMDAYELPEEFAHLQAQDMSKIGFINDIVRGIKKVIQKDETKPTIVKETVVTSANTNTAPLLKRAFMFLEDEDWQRADEYCEKVLDLDPENAQAYLGKLMVEFKVKKQEDLKNCDEPFDYSDNCEKVLKFGDIELCNVIMSYLEYIDDRNENTRLRLAYDKAKSKMNSASSEKAYLEAATLFKLIPNYEDSSELAKKCVEYAEIARKDEILWSAERKIRKNTIDEHKDAIELLKTIYNWKNAQTLIENSKKAIEELLIKEENDRIDVIYNSAKAMMAEKTLSSCTEAIKTFKKIPGWRDADAQILYCENMIENLKSKMEAERIERERQAEIERQKAEARAKRNKKIAIIAASVICVAIVFICILNNVIIPNGKYNDAIALMEEGKLDEAYSIFRNLGNYKDSIEKAGAIVKESLKNIKIGNYIKFGIYEQDNSKLNGKEVIEWLVLDIKDGKALVISKYELDCKQYNTSYTSVTWETCSLRKWLNNNFTNTAFSVYEKEIIPTVTVSADKNPDWSTNPGNATADQIFLLSIDEASKYFTSAKARRCKPTLYAIENGAYVDKKYDNCCNWWLRSPSKFQDRAALVVADGDFLKGGWRVDADLAGIRPAMWIQLP